MTKDIQQQREGDRMTDYKTRLHESITDLQQANKRGVLSREMRFEYIEAITEEYFRLTGEMPDGIALERLANLCLHEELTDSHPDKVTRTEYPFFSEHQFEERHKSESSFKLSEERGVDGRDYKPPVRRVRTNKDHRFIDKNAKIRNKERQRQYNEFTKVQPVVVRKMSN
jgi:hypothetical protein